MNLSLSRKMKIRDLFSGIGRKILVYFVLFSVIPIILISILGYKISEEIVINQNLRYLELQNELIRNRLSDFFRQAHFAISAQNPENMTIYEWINQRLKEQLPKECEDAQNIESFLRENEHRYQAFASLALVSPEGKTLCMSNPQMILPPADSLRPYLDKNYVTLLAGNRAHTGHPLVFMSTPVSPEKNRAYVLGFINLEQINNMIEHFSSQKQISQIYILSEHHRMLFSSEPQDLRTPTKHWKEMAFSRGHNFIQRWDGKEVLRSINNFPLLNWAVVSDVTYQTAMANLIKLRNQAILGVGGLLVVLIFLAFYLSQRISVPVRQLVYAAQDIGEGFLDTPIKIKTRDELALLATELDKMRENLLDYYDNLEQRVQERTRELKKAQFQIIHQEKMASIGLLAAGIAHEIGNPLTSISSLTQLLKRRLTDETNLNYLTTIMKNIDRISRIVRELVDFSRPSNYESRPTDINEVVQAAVGIVKYDKRSKNINFHLDFDPQIHQTVLVADQLLQVFINILFNAVDAMEGFGSDIYVKTRQEENLIAIRITDTGSGIAQDKINKIFEPFYTTKEVGLGTGLGLSVSYGIIRNFNGEISVQSTEGKGSTFIIQIPVKTTKEV